MQHRNTTSLEMPLFATRELTWQAVSRRWPDATRTGTGMRFFAKVPEAGLVFVVHAELGVSSWMAMIADDEAAAGLGMAVLDEVRRAAIEARPGYDAELAALPVASTPHLEPEPEPVFRTVAELGVVQPGQGDWMDADGFGWCDACHLPVCLAVVHDRPPEAVLTVLNREAATGLMPAAEARDWAVEQFEPYGTTLEAARRGAWTLVVEENGYQATTPDLLEQLSVGTAVAVAYWSVNADMQFLWAVDGHIVRRFDPLLDHGPDGGHGTWQPQEQGLPFGLEAPRPAALALIQRLTGVAITAADITGEPDRPALGMHPG